MVPGSAARKVKKGELLERNCAIACALHQKKKRADLWNQHKASPGPSTFQRKDEIMASHSSATAREEIPHATNTSKTNISNALKRRAQTRALIRYALETNAPCLAELVRRIDAGETTIDTVDLSTMP